MLALGTIIPLVFLMMFTICIYIPKDYISILPINAHS